MSGKDAENPSGGADVIEVRIAGETHRLVADAAPGATVREAAGLVDHRMRAVLEAAPGLSRERAAILAALNLGREVLVAQRGQKTVAADVGAAVARVRERLGELEAGAETPSDGRAPDTG